MINIQPFKTIRQTAKTTGVPECRMRQWVKAGIVPGFYSGNRFYVNFAKFQEKLDGGMTDGNM